MIMLVFIQQTSDGGYIVAGYSWSSSKYDILIIKLNSSGNIQWAKDNWRNKLIIMLILFNKLQMEAI
jgi:hypothetical protein